MKLAAPSFVDNSKALANPLIKHLAIIILLGAAGLYYVGSKRVPAPFNVDEIHYLLATQRLVEERSFNFDNGYDSFRSNSLLFLHPVPLAALPNQAKLTTFVPPVHTLLAAPFYAAGKRIGVFVLSALCGLGSLILIALLSARFTRRVTTLPNLTFRDGEARRAEAEAMWVGAILFGIGAYFAEYFYALSNHSVALLFVLIAVSLHPLWLFDKAPDEKLKRQVLLRSLLCGLAIGLAFATRLQNVVLIVALGGGLLLVPHGFWRGLAGYVIGVIPPIMLLGAFNKARFNTWSPISYGIPGESSFAGPFGFLLDQPILIVLVTAAIGALLFVARGYFLFGSPRGLQTEGASTAKNKIPWLAVAVPLAVILIIAIIPYFSRHFPERILGFRFQSIANEGDWNGHSMGIWSGPRKALLQSFPLGLVALLAPIWFFVQGHAQRPKDGEAAPTGAFALLTLFGSSMAAVLLLVLLLENNGGFFYNQRYLIEAVALSMPLLAALLVTARRHPDFKANNGEQNPEIEANAFGSSMAGRVLIPVGIAVGGFYIFQLYSATTTPLYLHWAPEQARVENMFNRSVPMFFAMVAAFCFIFDILMGLADTSGKRNGKSATKARSPFLRACWIALFPAALIVGGVNHFAFDMRSSNAYRAGRLIFAHELAKFIPEKSVIAVYGGVREPASILKENRDVWVIDAFREGWPAALDLMEKIARQHPERHYFLQPGPLTLDERNEYLHAKFRHMNLPSKRPLYLLRVRDEAQAVEEIPVWTPSYDVLSD